MEAGARDEEHSETQPGGIAAEPDNAALTRQDSLQEVTTTAIPQTAHVATPIEKGPSMEAGAGKEEHSETQHGGVAAEPENAATALAATPKKKKETGMEVEAGK